MNAPLRHANIDPIDALLMDVARRVQLSTSKHEIAERNFNALCQHVDREGSPLAGKVLQCYPSGSFAIGTAILSHVKTSQHDVDVVLEVDFPPDTSPRRLLQLLFEAINGPLGSRYHGRVKLNSRCVTVTYEDGTRVDLMPVARLAGEVERAAHLFHYKVETGEEYHKPVNPWGFAHHFNCKVEVMTDFARSYRNLGLTVLEKAATEPMPDHVPLSEKSPRVVAIQLSKRARDIDYRRRGKRCRKPPAVVIAGLALEMGPVQPRLIDELIALVTHMAQRITSESYKGQRFRLFNPSYARDEFTDRWPEDLQAQKIYAQDLRRFRAALYRLRNDALSPEQLKSELEQLFGESAATYAVEAFLEKRQQEASSGKLAFGRHGRVLIGAGAAISAATRARASTFEGGDKLPE
ncbi:MAG TPA: nucleotidyltransferase [Bryobacteraceae bacterium]|jgi:hypothetical protein